MLRRAERDLLRLREEVVGIAVQDHLADRTNRHHLFGNDLGRIEDVERELLGLLLGDDLNAELVFGEHAGFDRLPQIAAVEIRIRAGELDRFIPHQRVRAGRRVPVKLDEHRLALGVDEAV